MLKKWTFEKNRDTQTRCGFVSTVLKDAVSSFGVNINNFFVICLVKCHNYLWQLLVSDLYWEYCEVCVFSMPLYSGLVNNLSLRFCLPLCVVLLGDLIPCSTQVVQLGLVRNSTELFVFPLSNGIKGYEITVPCRTYFGYPFVAVPSGPQRVPRRQSYTSHVDLKYAVSLSK